MKYSVQYLLFVLTLFFLCQQHGLSSQDVDVEELLDNLGWKGQVGQMAQIDINLLLKEENGDYKLDQALLDKWIGEYGIGSVLNNHYPWQSLEYSNGAIRLQETARKFQKPPLIWGLDSIHGANYIKNAILTPQSINLAATFDPNLAEQAGKIASRDTQRVGIPWIFSPLVGLSWNPYWSRVYETFGEDPLVVGDMASSMIRGIQSNRTVAACAKHFIGYSIPHNGHDRAPSRIPMRHLYQYFLLPWKQALKANPMTVMESYTEIDGVPNVANHRLLNQLLRTELGFDGMLVTDYNEVNNLEWWHRLANDSEHALLMAMTEGTIDMAMMGASLEQLQAFFEGMDIIRTKALEVRVRDSARRVLHLKKDINMFSENLVDPPPENIESLTQIIDMTRQSIVLAKNDNETLPLQGDTKIRVLVTGPTSDSLSFQTGGWTGEWQGVNSNNEKAWFEGIHQKTVRQGLQGDDFFDVTYECGVDILGNDCGNPQENNDEEDRISKLLNTVKVWIHPTTTSDAALDAIVVCLGEENYAEKPGDITDLRLPQGQYDLVKALREALNGRHNNTKIILVYFGGRPRLLAEVEPLVDAILLGFLPGPYAGTVIAEILAGKTNPSARLPITYPKHPDVSGIPYYHEVSDMCTKNTGGSLPHWENMPCEVQWPFGHGLTYSRFEYSNLHLSTLTLKQHWHDESEDEDYSPSDAESLTVTVTVTNDSDRDGFETLLLFSFDQFRSTTPEYKRLRGYQKIWLESGVSRDVSFTISLEDLRFVGPHDDSHYILQDGLQFRLGIGASVDCRGGNGKRMCSDLVTIQTEQKYVGACEAACSTWRESDCTKKAFPSLAACRESCAFIHYDVEDVGLNNDGWGWNYVHCLEQIVRSKGFDYKKDCWKLTSFCRDVTQTTGMDEYGSGNDRRSGPSSLAILVSLCIGFIASFMIWFSMRGGFASTGVPPRHNKKGEEYSNVEFSSIGGTDCEVC